MSALAISTTRKSGKKRNLAAVLLLAVILVSSFIVFESIHLSTQPQTITVSHDELIDYALSLINLDRQENGLQNVTLSTINSGQQHADDMLKNGYFSHWDLQGYKPYVRYTLAGGKGAVTENVGLIENWLAAGITQKQALNQSEWSMVHEDADWNWGHKQNILNPLHNYVSIGIASDHDRLYFVEDFEDNYISWTQLQINKTQAYLEGTIQTTQQNNIQQIAVFYDNAKPLTTLQLQETPYNGSYNPGAYVGSVLPPNWQATQGITITADSWYQTGNHFRFSFSLAKAIEANCEGIYTLYIETGSSTENALTSYSFVVQ